MRQLTEMPVSWGGGTESPLMTITGGSLLGTAAGTTVSALIRQVSPLHVSTVKPARYNRAEYQ